MTAFFIEYVMRRYSLHRSHPQYLFPVLFKESSLCVRYRTEHAGRKWDNDNECGKCLGSGRFDFELDRIKPGFANFPNISTAMIGVAH